MCMIKVRDRELSGAVDILINERPVKVWPATLANRIEERLRAQRAEVFNSWASERQGGGHVPQRFGDAIAELRSCSQWPLRD